MANILTLPDLDTTGESIQDVLSEDRDVSIRIESVVERSFSKLNIIEDVLKSQLAIQEQQANFLRTQAENAEFAAEEARREAERSRLAASSATATPATDQPSGGGFGLGGIAAGLAAGGAGAALRTLAGRLLRGGGLAALGYFFGDELGKFLATEADALLDDAGVSQEWQNTIVNSLRENTDTALIFGGISKILFRRTLPGLIAGYVLGGLDIEKLFSNDEAERQEFYQNLEDEIITGWDFIYDRPQSALIFGLGAGLALLTRGPLLKRLAVGLIGAYGLSNLLPGDEDIDTFNTRMTNAVVDELTIMGFDPELAATAVDAGGAAMTGLTSSWLFGLINKRLKIPAFIAGFVWDYFDLSRIFTQEGRDDLLNSTEEEVRRLLAGEGATEDYIDAVIATLGIGYAARQGSRLVTGLFNAPTQPEAPVVEPPAPAPRSTLPSSLLGPDGQPINRVPPAQPSSVLGPDGRPITPRATATTTTQAAEDAARTITDPKYRKIYRALVKGLGVLGIAFTAVQLYELAGILNSDASDDVKQAAIVQFIVPFVSSTTLAVAGGILGTTFGPWGSLIGAVVGGVGGAFAGDLLATYVVKWAFEENPPSATPQIGGISSQADVDAYLREYGIEPPVRAPQQDGGRGSVVEAPGARALAAQISGTQAQLNTAIQERDEASNRRDRREANQNVTRLETALEELQEELEELNDRFQAARPQGVSYSSGSNAGAGNIIMAGFRPSFGNARLMNASLNNNSAASSSVEQIMEALKSKESGGDYSAENEDPRSSASGAYQYIDSTWRSLTRKYGIGQEYARAKDAPPNIQDEVARRNIQEILANNNGNIAAVPNMWYSGNAQGRLTEEQLAANDGYTQERYSADFFRRLGQNPTGGSMLASVGESSAGGFFSQFSGGLGAILNSDNPEQVGALMIQDFFSQIGVGRPGVTPAAVEMNNGSETRTTAPIVVNAPQINNDNSVQASGGGGRERASQQLAIAPVGEQSATSTMRDWIDATFA